MSNIDKQACQVSRYDLVSGYMQKWPDGEFVYHSDYQALLDELEAKDAKIANLTAECDALREGEMGDAKHSNTRAAADIYFQLVEECEIPAGGSLVEYVSQLRECAAEERYVDILRQARSFREAHDAASEIIRKLERNKPTVKLPTTRLWAGKIACYEESEVVAMLERAGINIDAAGKGE